MRDSRNFIGLLGLLLGVLGTVATWPAQASERRFTLTYESGVLSPGHVELEPWTTFRFGRERYFSRFDQRLEFEFGVVDNLQTALYWNFSAATADVQDAMGTVTRESALEFQGISSEWKYKLSDPVADVLGSALYLEGSLGPSEAEIEAKVILDKRVGSLLLAANLVGEYELEFEREPGGEAETETELKTELDLGASYFLTPDVTLGLELQQVSEIHEGELEYAVLYGGPVLAVAREGWWAALTVAPQLVAFKGASQNSRLDLDHNEKLRARLLLGFDL
jgi:hypothetical protein